MAKLLASEATWHAADATLQTYGGFAFAKEYDIERKWREVPPLPDRADLDQPDPRLYRPARARHAAVVLSAGTGTGRTRLTRSRLRAPHPARGHRALRHRLSGTAMPARAAAGSAPPDTPSAWRRACAFDSAVKSGKARCAWTAHLSIDFHLLHHVHALPAGGVRRGRKKRIAASSTPSWQPRHGAARRRGIRAQRSPGDGSPEDRLRSGQTEAP